MIVQFGDRAYRYRLLNRAGRNRERRDAIVYRNLRIFL